jgi:ADP-ribosylglycohydrolase
MKQPILSKLKRPIDHDLSNLEADDLNEIRQLRPPGPRRLWNALDESVYREKLEGALLGRFAGCTLGVPVEGWSPERMRDFTREDNEPFPPVDYWVRVTQPLEMHYGRTRREAFSRGKMHGVPVDDDIAYTLLGLLIAEEYGPHFTTEEVGKTWLKYLPIACTAEEVALRNLKAGISALLAGETDNPFSEWIGADIRSDPWGYLAPGMPECAAGMAYRDAFLSHRQEGIYGSMFFSAVIAAAFSVKSPLEAIQIGLTEIPSGCQLARHVNWVLDESIHVTDYQQAREAVNRRFPGMPQAHTLNNACLSVFGLAIGGMDFTRVIGETVAMGMDNDCTAATAGSIVGAIAGRRGIPRHWYENFDDTIQSYLIGIPEFGLKDVIDRFTFQAKRVAGENHQFG